MRARTLIGLFGIVVLLGGPGCGGPEVNADYAPGTDFSRFQSWAWSPDQGQVPDDPRVNPEALRKRIEDSIDAVLPTRGLARAAEGSPADLLVRYHASLERKVTYDAITSGYRRDWPETTVYTREFDVGTLVIDLVTPDKQLMWRGYAKGELKVEASAEERDRRARAAVERILAQYPPEKK